MKRFRLPRKPHVYFYTHRKASYIFKQEFANLTPHNKQNELVNMLMSCEDLVYKTMRGGHTVKVTVKIKEV